MGTVTYFPIDKVVEVRDAAESARGHGARGTAPGWEESKLDPMRVVEVFDPLRVKPGFKLISYQRSGSLGIGGNGFVWAIPEYQGYPGLGQCVTVNPPKVGFLSPKELDQETPRPPEALDYAMDAIEGDGAPWSYLCASILARELAEFGAWWHGQDWTTHRILGGDPWSFPAPKEGKCFRDMPRTDESEWHWLETKPAEWRPRVSEEGDQVTVTFYSVTGHGWERIVLHQDGYMRGSYRLTGSGKEVARGHGGFTF